MKKFILKRKGETTDLGKFNSKQDAVDAMNDEIDENNAYLYLAGEDEDWLCPLDFELEEVEVEDDPAVLVPDYKAALEYLGIGKTVIILPIEGERNPLTGPTAAFLKLVTIAAAWNRIDGFVPDFSNGYQNKYYPWFEYRKDAAGFVFANTYCTAT